jgi:V/A-type H+-transporting ATPase subunit I
MIVPMKKVHVVCQDKDARDTVGRLRQMGVVHVEHVRQPQTKEIAAGQDGIAVCRAAFDILRRNNEKGITAAVQQTAERRDWLDLARHIVDLDKRIEQLKEARVTLAVKIKDWERWGDFDPAEIIALQEKGIFIRLFEIPEKEIAALPEQCVVKTVFRSGGIAACSVVSREMVELPYRQISLPKLGLAAMRKKLSEDQQVIEQLENELLGLVPMMKDFTAELARSEKQLQFLFAVEGMGQATGLAYLAGFIPAHQLVRVEEAVRAQHWALLAEDPTEDDDPPTLLRQPKWISIIQPLLNFLGITPGYRELDVGAPFLIFFSIFFGILIGDAGYGLIYILLTKFLLKKKLGPQHSSTVVLLYILSVSTIIWGALTGTFFGQQWLLGKGICGFTPGLNDAKTLQTVCFLIGALHLSIGHVWRTVLKLPSLSALADVGWLLIVWAAFFLARTLILDAAFPVFGKPLLFVGIGLVVLFTAPQKNMLKAIGVGTGAIALSLVNSFTDVVSYIRLFAVGMAGVAIADAGNAMAASYDNVIIAAVVVILGHMLNLVMGLMSVLVHGIRLNVLEFSNHANITWSGKEYLPLAE